MTHGDDLQAGRQVELWADGRRRVHLGRDGPRHDPPRPLRQGDTAQGEVQGGQAAPTQVACQHNTTATDTDRLPPLRWPANTTATDRLPPLRWPAKKKKHLFWVDT